MANKDLRTVDLDDDVWGDNDDPPPYSSTTVRDEVPEDHSIGFRKEYLFSAKGALKCIEIVLSLIGFVAVAAGDALSGFVFWVTISAFIATTILFLLVSFNIYSRIPSHHFHLYELIFCLLYTLKYFIAAIIAGVSRYRSPSTMTACAICAVAFLMYLLDAFFTYKQLKAIREDMKHRQAAGEGASNRRTGDTFCFIF